MKVAVLGSTGTAGSRVVRRLVATDIEVVEGSRANGIDLVTGDGLAALLSDVDVVVDASNPAPPDDAVPWGRAMTTATRNVVAACAEQQVDHLVFLSIIGIEDPAFDGFDYYLAKREQERIVDGSGPRATIVKTTQWHEFATNPAAVTFRDDRVEVRDWLLQPVAADAVADALVQEVLAPSGRRQVLITGPERVRLAELTRRYLRARGDERPVHALDPQLPELADGALVAPDEAAVVGPGVEEWLGTVR